MNRPTARLALVLITCACVTEAEGNSGLVVFVVDNSNQGVHSNVFEKESNTFLGTTDSNGKLTDNDYLCSGHKTIQVKPLDKIYFDPAPAPCRNPEHFIAEVRTMPKGEIAFDQFSQSFTYNDGLEGLVNYKAALIVEASGSKSGTNDATETCNIDYSFGVEKSKYKLTEKGWDKVVDVIDHPSDFVLINKDEAAQELDRAKIDWGRVIPTVNKADNSIFVFVPRPCGEIKAQSNLFAKSIEALYNNKIKDGTINQSDLTSFINISPK